MSLLKSGFVKDLSTKPGFPDTPARFLLAVSMPAQSDGPQQAVSEANMGL
jgi:hypothetical protein